MYPVIVFYGPSLEGYIPIPGDPRIRFFGQAFGSLGFFFGLNKLLQKNSMVISNLLLSILCLSVIFLMGFRTMSVLIVFFAYLLIIRVKGLNWNFFWYGLLCFIVVILILQMPVFNKIIQNMVLRNRTETLSNSEYARVLQFEYFTKHHFKSFLEFIFGSGYPHPKQFCAYSQYMYELSNNSNINWVDLGLLSLSWVIGIPAVLIMIAYSIKAFLLKVPPAYYYLGMWFIYLVAVSFTTAEFFREGNFVVQAFALYLVEKVYSDRMQKTI